MTAPTIPVPNGCAACGIDYQGHCGRWHPMVGLHQWIEPTDAQRLIRIRARRDPPLRRATVYQVADQ